MNAHRRQIRTVETAASAEEAAAIAAAIGRFLRATAPEPAAGHAPASPWVRAALLEGIEREPGHLGWI